jgi:hypothetical protein
MTAPSDRRRGSWPAPASATTGSPCSTWAILRGLSESWIQWVIRNPDGGATGELASGLEGKDQVAPGSNGATSRTSVTCARSQSCIHMASVIALLVEERDIT